MDGEAPRAGKFQRADITAQGAPRASVPFVQLETLWINTGTLCNVECKHCYIASSPINDRLAYIKATEIAPFLDEAKIMGAREIGFTGGEPFMNPEMSTMAEAALSRGFETLILTNAMKPMMRPQVREKLLSLRTRYEHRLSMRISFDHYAAQAHNAERGQGAFEAGMDGLKWLRDNKFRITVASRELSGETELQLREGFAKLFAEHAIPLNANDPTTLVIFPEMDAVKDAPEISTACWSILNKDPAQIMCATSRMLIKRKGETGPVILSCTLLPYDGQFEMGESLAEASAAVKLNHPFCAQFCVLGGASCSG